MLMFVESIEEYTGYSNVGYGVPATLRNSTSKYWFGVSQMRVKMGSNPSGSSKSNVSKELCASIFIVRWRNGRRMNKG